MNLNHTRFTAALARIDAANSLDPNGKELLYSQRMTAWLDRLRPDASEALRIAARAHHIQRWQIPRTDYPNDRIGYLRWRTTLYQFHAKQTADILQTVGYDPDTIARVQSLILKQNIKSDSETQTLEDVICVVFLESYFADFATQHDDAKVINILQKTWKKMSPLGHAAALKLDFPNGALHLIKQALAPPGAPENP